MGPKDWVAAAPLSRMVSLVAFGGPVAPWVVWEAISVKGGQASLELWGLVEMGSREEVFREY